MASTIALVSTDLKRILAYSTISHLGLMMLSLGAFGVAAAMFHLMAHGFSKALLVPWRGQRDARRGTDRHPPHGRPEARYAHHRPHLHHRGPLS